MRLPFFLMLLTSAVEGGQAPSFSDLSTTEPYDEYISDEIYAGIESDEFGVYYYDVYDSTTVCDSTTVYDSTTVCDSTAMYDDTAAIYYSAMSADNTPEIRENNDVNSISYGPVRRRLAPPRKYERLPPGQAVLLPNGTPGPRSIYVRPHYTYIHPITVHSTVGHTSVPYHLTQTSVRPSSFAGTAFLPGAL